MQLSDLIVKRTFKLKEQVYTARFFQTAGLFGIKKTESKKLLNGLIKNGKITRIKNGFIKLKW